jgi:hypothetical protein
MAKAEEEIRIDDTRVISIRANEALRTLARLIGRQIGCKQFEPKRAKARKRRFLAKTK